MKKWTLLLVLLLCMGLFAAQAEAASSPLGYEMQYEHTLFQYERVGELDHFAWDVEDGSMVASIDVELCAGQSLDDVIAARTANVPGNMGVTVVGENQVKLYEISPSEANPEEYEAHAFVPAGDDVLVFELWGDMQRSDDLSGLLLNMLSTVALPGDAEVEYVQCEICGRFYPAGNIFRNHICAGAWPVLKADGGAELVLCERCGGWYEAGNIFCNHICSGSQARNSAQLGLDLAFCERCGGWFEAGNVFRNHICTGVEEPAELVQCERCGGWYEAGNIFRNHICAGAESEAELAYCEKCGGWYEVGNVFRNHVCSGLEEPAELVQCEKCGGWYEEGNIFRNHICSGAQ